MTTINLGSGVAYVTGGGSYTISGTVAGVYTYDVQVSGSDANVTIATPVTFSDYVAAITIYQGANQNTIVNKADIVGYEYGIRIAGNSNVITNTGIGTITTGLFPGHSDKVFGVAVSFYADKAESHYATGGTVVNMGLITPQTLSYGVAIAMPAGGTVTNAIGGTIQGDTLFDIKVEEGPTAHTATSGVYSVGTGVVVNAGTMIGEGSWFFAAVGLYNGGTVTNTGEILTTTGQKYGVRISGAAGTVTNAGSIAGGSVNAVEFANIAGNRMIVDPGALFGGKVNGADTASSVLELASGGAGTMTSGLNAEYYNFRTFLVDSGANWTLAGTNSILSGQTLTNNGTLNSTGSLVNAGLIQLNAGSLQIATLGGTGTIDLNATSGITLALSTQAATANVVAGMTIASGTVSGQTIELTGVSITSASLVDSNTIAVITSTGGTIDINLAGAPTGNQFHFQNTGGNAFLEDATTVCYLAGTRIRTDRGEIPVEDLAIGDLVITLDGTAKPIRWIGRRAYASAFAAGNRGVIPVLIKQGALGDNVPERDLYVSPLHAMFFGDVLVPAQDLVNGETILRCPDIDPIRYFHIELENHDVIFAEGAPAETFVDCDSRGIFHNAREFAELYPDATTDARRFCFPRIESGPVLDQIRRDIALRAGLTDATPGPLDGNLDGMDGTRITGWAFDPAHPDTQVVLEILDEDGLLARVTANRYRADLEAAGIGDGRHGFEVVLSHPLASHMRHEIRARRLADRRELGGSPLTIEPYDRRTLVADTGRLIGLAIAGANEAQARDDVLDTLLQGIEQVRRLRLAQPPRSRRRRALFVGANLPRAGQGTVLADVETLRAQGWEVEIVASAELAGGDEAVAALKAFSVTCHQAPLVASVEELLRRKRDAYDLVSLTDDASAEAYAALVRVWQPRVALVFGAVAQTPGAARAA